MISHFRGIFAAFPHFDFLRLCHRDAGQNLFRGGLWRGCEIEVKGAGGDPNIVIVGLPAAAVKEAWDRVTTAIANSGYFWPRGRTAINVAPAAIKKEGPSFETRRDSPLKF